MVFNKERLFEKTGEVLLKLEKIKHPKAHFHIERLNRALAVSQINGPRRDHWLEELAARIYLAEGLLEAKTDVSEYHNNGPAPRAALLRYLND